VRSLLAYSPQLCGLAANPALPDDLLERFIATADAWLCLELAERDDLSLAHARALASRGDTEVTVVLVWQGFALSDVDRSLPEVLLALLGVGAVPTSSARTLLLGHPPAWVRVGLAECGHLPDDVATALAGDGDLEVVETLARSAQLTAELAVVLARHPHLAVRRALAINVTAPVPVLAALGRDGGRPPAAFCRGCDGGPEPPGVSCHGGHEAALVDLDYALGTNPRTPSDVVARLVDHTSAYVRRTVAERPDLHPEAYRRLATDPMPGVRCTVAANSGIGADLIRAMADDDTFGVRRSLAHNPAIPLDVLTTIAPMTKIGPAVLPRVAAATAEEVDTLARSPVAQMRRLLAERRDLPVDIVHRLAADADAKVVASIVPDQRLTDERLRAILSRHGARVAARLALNPACGPDLLHELVRLTPPVRKAVRGVAAHPHATGPTLALCLSDDRARRVAARHPALRSDTVVALLRDPDPCVVEAAAANPALPRSAMAELLRAEDS
jgi:hypothetical protein